METSRSGYSAGADHPGGRPREEHTDRLGPGGSGRNRPTIGLHDVNSTVFQPLLKICQVTVDQRRDVGIYDRSTPALKLTVLGQDLVRGAHTQASAPQPLRNLPLVRRIDIRMKQTNGNDIDFEAAQPGSKLADGAAVQALKQLSVCIQSLRHSEHKARLDDRTPRRHKEIVEFGSRLAADVDYIFKTFGRNECNFGAFAFEDRVSRYRRAMHDVQRCAIIRKFSDAFEDCTRGVLGRRAALVKQEAIIVEANKVREGAPGIHANPQIDRGRMAKLPMACQFLKTTGSHRR